MGTAWRMSLVSALQLLKRHHSLSSVLSRLVIDPSEFQPYLRPGSTTHLQYLQCIVEEKGSEIRRQGWCSARFWSFLPLPFSKLQATLGTAAATVIKAPGLVRTHFRMSNIAWYVLPLLLICLCLCTAHYSSLLIA